MCESTLLQISTRRIVICSSTSLHYTKPDWSSPCSGDLGDADAETERIKNLADEEHSRTLTRLLAAPLDVADGMVLKIGSSLEAKKGAHLARPKEDCCFMEDRLVLTRARYWQKESQLEVHLVNHFQKETHLVPIRKNSRRRRGWNWFNG